MHYYLIRHGLHCFAVWLSCSGLASQAASLDEAIAEHIQAQQRSAEQQQAIQQLDDQALQLVTEIQRLEQQLQDSQTHNQRLTQLISAQQQQLAELDAQKQQIDATREQLLPLIWDMWERLADFVQLDLPFLPSQRHAALEQLKQRLVSGQDSLAQQYQQLLEAYQQEWQAGLGLAHYQDQLSSGQPIDVLQVGRIALYYRTLDGSQIGYWNSQQATWQPLSKRYQLTIEQGLRMARQQAAPELLTLPLTRQEQP